MNNFYPSSSPKSMGLMSMDTTIQPPSSSSLYNQSTTFYQNQRNSSPIYRSSSLPYDSGQNQIPYHDPSHIRVKTPVFDEFLTPPPSSSAYIPVNNSSLSVHSYMNVSFQDTMNNPPPPLSTMTSSPFNHHNTTYPF